MTDSLRLIPANSPDWAAWVDGARHDFHHTAAHHLVWQEAGAGEAWLAVFGSATRYVAWPHLLRTLDGVSTADRTLYDVTDVDGYCGPLSVGCPPGDAFVREALEAIADHWRRARVVSVFARFHPLLMNQFCFGGAPPQGSPEGACPVIPGLRHEGHTVSMDLGLGDEEARSEYRESHLRHIRRALRQGLTTEIDNSRPAFREFVDLYYQTMLRNGAGARYFFSEPFLESLRQSLGSAATIHHARVQGKTVAAVLITEYSGIVQYLLGGVRDEFCHLSPLKLLLDSVRQWARQRGNRDFHLGGGRGCNDEDPLFYFKAGFSRRRHCFYTGRWILDQERYDRLTGERLGNCGPNKTACCVDYFPAYRTPPNEDRPAPRDIARESAADGCKEIPSRASSRSVLHS
jgi:hypothetical protein